MFTAELAACVQKGSEICAQPASVGQDHFTTLVVSITGLAGIMITTFGLMYRRAGQAEQRATEAREAVTNNHKTHIRDDLDRFRDQVTERFDNAEKREITRDARMQTIMDALVSLGAKVESTHEEVERTRGGTPIVAGELED